MFEIILIALLVAVVALLVGLVLNVNKSLRRQTSIWRLLRESREQGDGAQLVEAVAQLQSIAVSIDRVAARCDAMDEKLAEFVEHGGGDGSAAMREVLQNLSSGIDRLETPLLDMRESLTMTEVERLADEVKRTLQNLGFDQYTIGTDLAALEGGSGKVQVEVARDGVSSKGYLVLRDGSVIEHKISQSYEMFP